MSEYKGSQKKFTHKRCKLLKCRYNYLSPGEYCQECIGCPYLKPKVNGK